MSISAEGEAYNRPDKSNRRPIQDEIKETIRRLSVSLNRGNSVDGEVGDGSGLAKERLGFDLMSINCSRGHFVNKVTPNSPAAEAGIEHGDLLLKINEVNIKEATHQAVVDLLRDLVIAGKFNEQIDLTVVKARNSSNSEVKND